jgi:hypothetical protein
MYAVLQALPGIEELLDLLPAIPYLTLCRSGPHPLLSPTA